MKFATKIGRLKKRCKRNRKESKPRLNRRHLTTTQAPQAGGASARMESVPDVLPGGRAHSRDDLGPGHTSWAVVEASPPSGLVRKVVELL